MINVLSIVYSMPFFAGALVGMVVMRFYQRHQCKVADRRHPLPGGARRHAPGISRTWLGYALSVAVLGYVVLQVNQTEQHYRQLADSVASCQREFNAALAARAAISAENDKLSRQQRGLLADSDVAESTWIDRLINLPPEIKNLPQDDPRVQTYGQTVTRIYFQRSGQINAQIQAINERQEQLDKDRADHPLPEPTCGQ